MAGAHEWRRAEIFRGRDPRRRRRGSAGTLSTARGGDGPVRLGRHRLLGPPSPRPPPRRPPQRRPRARDTPRGGQRFRDLARGGDPRPPSHLAPGPASARPRRLAHDGVTVGWAVPAGTTWTGPVAHAQAINVEGVVLRGVHDLISALEQLLRDDVLKLLGDSDPVPEGSIVVGDPA